ncbi:Rhodopsin, GQ-coupled [Trichoplax sp. H2]|nr:Rhodopsin, GQ-coupled [Trichoplax sp. H2]|eukprot:RDD43165.1 Rhodopsin, GQ-coupled [Trichoplax sp. H2]
MCNLIASINESLNENRTSTPATHENSTQTTNVIPFLYVFFAILAIIDNFMICLLFLSHRSLLNQASNRFILLLATVDVLTVIIVIISPVGQVFGDNYPYPRDRSIGPIFCAVIGSEYFIWAFGFTSVYTIAILSIERLYMVVQPRYYKKLFTSSNVNMMIAGLIVLGLIIAMANPFQSRYEPYVKKPCKWVPLTKNEQINTILYTVIFVMQFLLPSTIISTCYTIIACKIRKISIMDVSMTHSIKSVNNRRVKRQVTLMIFAASIILIICWLPNQIYFLLVQLKVVETLTSIHLLTKILVIANSSLNPFVYVIFNKNYRKLMMQIFCKIYRRQFWGLRRKKVHLQVP